MYCRQCGKPINDNQELCDECMSKNNQNVYQTTAQETSSVNQPNMNYNNNQNDYNQNPQYNTNTQNQSQQSNNYQVNNNPNAKSKIAAGLLGIFLGALGVHNFYLGYTSKAVAQLLISLLSCGVLSWISGIWGLIEGILLLTGSITIDADGNPLRD